MSTINEDDSAVRGRLSWVATRSPNQIHVAIVGATLTLMYIVGAPIAMRVSIRWPAPYWLAIALSGPYFLLMFVAPVVCSLALRRSGTFAHGNQDDFGYRLGAFALAASFFSAMLARPFYLHKERTEDEGEHDKASAGDTE